MGREHLSHRPLEEDEFYLRAAADAREDEHFGYLRTEEQVQAAAHRIRQQARVLGSTIVGNVDSQQEFPAPPEV